MAKTKFTHNFIANITTKELMKLTKNELLQMNKIASLWASNRRGEFLREYSKEIRNKGSIPKPSAYRESKRISDEESYRSHKLLKKYVLTNSNLIESNWIGKNFKVGTQKDNVDQLRANFLEIKRYLTDKTTTLSGWKSSLSDIIKMLSEKTQQDMSYLDDADNYESYWQIYNRIKDNDFVISSEWDSDTIIKKVNSFVTDENILNVDEVVGKIEDDIKENYEKKRSSDVSNISGFGIGKNKHRG